MGSRIMHAIIAYQIAQQLELKEQEAFVLGGVAPDAPLQKDASHFYDGLVADYSRRIDYKGFLQKYNQYSNQAFVLGYYTHLLADDIWLTGFYLPWLRNRMEANNDIYVLYHRDFQLLNGKLLAHYGIEEELVTLLGQVRLESFIEEVTTSELHAFVPHVLNDMNDKEDQLLEELCVFTDMQIIGYIETAIARGVFEIQKHRGTQVCQK